MYLTVNQNFIDILKSKSSYFFQSIFNKRSLSKQQHDDLYLCSTNQVADVVQLPPSSSPSNRADSAAWQMWLRRNSLFIYNDIKEISQEQDTFRNY
jgi:hypothetical protein